MVLQRWAAARGWQPPPALEQAARRNARPPAYPRGWPGFLVPPFELLPAPREVDLSHLVAAYDDYDQLNEAHFAGVLPPLRIRINPRLRSLGGRIDPRRRDLELNYFRLEELPATRVEVVFHELIHLWLYTRGLPAGHTAEFRRKMLERGHCSIRYGVPGDPKGPRHAYPGSDRRVVYHCPHCERQYTRRAAYRQPMLCGSCLREGRGHHRIVLVARLEGQDPR
ncbi:MAG: SprT-like domain-containing protein [Fimbriimonadaceae bacterium]|nr:SprT-like domain-containing protein [Fimbriimonadaceae bacterium]